MNPRVVGIDPSLTATGIASSLTWCAKLGIDGVTKMPVWEKTEAIEFLADEIIEEIGQPDLVVIEQVDTARAYGGASERAGLFWLLARRLRGREIPFTDVASAQLKIYATGTSQCKKGAVIDAVARRWPKFETGGDDNMCDATVLTAMGADHLGAPLAPMPATHRRALDKVTWPEVRL
jgi:crossover junction endodeoxyribonuclease RuvC